MKFKINNTEWEIEEVEKDKMTCESSEWTQGLTIYLEQKILLLKGQPNIERTLKHELTHVWLYEYGHNQQDENKKYDYEDVCEIVASSNDFINEVVNEYLRIKLLYMCDPDKNIECKKKNCYTNNGECMQTDNKKYAKRKISNEH